MVPTLEPVATRMSSTDVATTPFSTNSSRAQAMIASRRDAVVSALLTTSILLVAGTLGGVPSTVAAGGNRPARTISWANTRGPLKPVVVVSPVDGGDSEGDRFEAPLTRPWVAE